MEEPCHLGGISHLGFLGTQTLPAHKAEGLPTSSEGQAVRTSGFVGHRGSATTAPLSLKREMQTHG